MLAGWPPPRFPRSFWLELSRRLSLRGARRQLSGPGSGARFFDRFAELFDDLVADSLDLVWSFQGRGVNHRYQLEGRARAIRLARPGLVGAFPIANLHDVSTPFLMSLSSMDCKHHSPAIVWQNRRSSAPPAPGRIPPTH